MLWSLFSRKNYEQERSASSLKVLDPASDSNDRLVGSFELPSGYTCAKDAARSAFATLVLQVFLTAFYRALKIRCAWTV